jgi:hypothetical protein
MSELEKVAKYLNTDIEQIQLFDFKTKELLVAGLITKSRKTSTPKKMKIESVYALYKNEIIELLELNLKLSNVGKILISTIERDGNNPPSYQAIYGLLKSILKSDEETAKK